MDLIEFLNNLKFKKIESNQILKRYEIVFKKSNFMFINLIIIR